MTVAASRYKYFVAVSPGLEPLLLAELQQCGIAGQMMAGGVECSGSVDVLWQIHRFSRLAESVRVRLRPFQAKSFAQLEAGLNRLPWHAYRSAGARLQVSATCHQSRLYHTGAVVERTLRAAATSKPPQSIASGTDCADGTPRVTEQKLYVRIERDVVQVSVDASGERLHRRGYRTHVVAAPLRETLAAAAIHLLLETPSNSAFRTLWDPCCGSGTLICEWLLMHSSSVPDPRRSYAFEFWPIHNPVNYARWQQHQAAAEASNSDVHAFGSDVDPRAIAAATNNLALAGVIQKCQLFASDFRELVGRIPRGTAIVTNLPYGVRLQDRRNASRIFAELDELLRRRADLRPVVALSTVSPPSVAKCRWRRAATFANGGLRVSAWSLA